MKRLRYLLYALLMVVVLPVTVPAIFFAFGRAAPAALGSYFAEIWSYLKGEE
jgi:ABC-type transport system involved in cytochrome c biogenesis permease component